MLLKLFHKREMQPNSSYGININYHVPKPDKDTIYYRHKSINVIQYLNRQQKSPDQFKKRKKGL